MWRSTDPQGNESAKIKYEIVPYTMGRGLDVGCGSRKVYDHMIGVDNLHHAHAFGITFERRPDVVSDCTKLDLFADASMDFVFSSHTLEHMEDAEAVLKEWWRLIKVGGHLVLYLPDEDLYPRVGEPGANPDHKWNLSREKVIEWMKGVGSWDLVVNEQRAGGREYSFLQIFQKL